MPYHKATGVFPKAQEAAGQYSCVLFGRSSCWMVVICSWRGRFGLELSELLPLGLAGQFCDLVALWLRVQVSGCCFQFRREVATERVRFVVSERERWWCEVGSWLGAISVGRPVRTGTPWPPVVDDYSIANQPKNLGLYAKAAIPNHWCSAFSQVN